MTDSPTAVLPSHTETPNGVGGGKELAARTGQGEQHTNSSTMTINLATIVQLIVLVVGMLLLLYFFYNKMSTISHLPHLLTNILESLFYNFAFFLSRSL